MPGLVSSGPVVGTNQPHPFLGRLQVTQLAGSPIIRCARVQFKTKVEASVLGKGAGSRPDYGGGRRELRLHGYGTEEPSIVLAAVISVTRRPVAAGPPGRTKRRSLCTHRSCPSRLPE